MKNRNNYFAICFLLILCIPTIGCGADIKGVVQDSTGKPIPGIEVSIKNSDIATTTRNDGSFKLKFVEGDIEILFKKNGKNFDCLPTSIGKNSLTKDRYPKGLDIGVIKCPCIYQKTSDEGELVFGSTNSRFTVKNGTIIDSQTGLMWQAIDGGVKRSWEQAKSYCENLSLAGYSDWRLPTYQETGSIEINFRPDPVFNSGRRCCWTSTIPGGNAYLYAWVDCGAGGSSHEKKTEQYYVRAVRNGQ